MRARNFVTGIVVFALALLAGLASTFILSKEYEVYKAPPVVTEPLKLRTRPFGEQGSGASGPDRGISDGVSANNAPNPCAGTCDLKILSKPRANFTERARQNEIQGAVRLRITFLANGTIGQISPISGLPYGLTEEAIAAARDIRFDPATKDGVPYTVQKVLEYTFTIY